MLGTTEIAVLEILKESLFDIPAQIPESVDWKAVFQELKMQSLVPLAYITMKRHGGLDAELQAMGMKIYAAQIHRWYAMMQEQIEILDLLSQYGYTAAVIKGNGLSVYYPEAQLRGSGDIDLLVRWEQYDEIYDFLTSNGYRLMEEREPEKHHFAVRGKEYVIEVHKRPGGTRLHGTDGQTELLHFFQEGLDNLQWITCGTYNIPVLPPKYNAMILLLHTAQHMPEGIGLRHIIDWMMFTAHYIDDEFWNRELKSYAMKGQVQTLAIVCTKMCQEYLGLKDSITWCSNADKKAVEDLIEYVFQQGDFGNKAAESDSEVRLWAESKSLKDFWKRVSESSHYSMPLADKYKILRPAAVVYQLWRYTVKGLSRENPLETVENVKEGQERRRFFSELGIK